MAEFLGVYKMKGFDRYAAPRWQMVPMLGVRYVLLRAGPGLTVASANTALVTVTEVPSAGLSATDRYPISPGDRVFKLEGKGSGTTNVQAKTAAGATSAQLDVDVKTRKTVNLTFNFVKDSAGHHTARNTANVAHWLKSIKYIYRGQTNIRFRQKLNRWVTVPQNLGRVVRFSSHLPGVPAAQHEWAVVTALGDPAADMNVFFVWRYEQDNTPFTDQTDAGTLTNNCIFEDGAGTQVGETLAHEIGHYLGCPDHYLAARKRELMYGITDSRGIHIPKQDANVMNP